MVRPFSLITSNGVIFLRRKEGNFSALFQLEEFKDKRLKKIAIQKGLKEEEKLGATIMGDIVIDELKKSAEKLTEKRED
jgi:hypothetical protein